jgi:methylmalonyl-CoA mutase N-terminal domain/subunit
MDVMIREHIADIDDHGGAIAAADSGYMRRQMTATDLEWMAERERGDRHIVASNCYTGSEDEDREIEFQRFNPAVLRDQVEGLQKVRKERDNAAVKKALEAVGTEAAAGRNVMPSVIDAVREYATVGEIMGKFKEVWGPWTEATG